MAKAETHYFKGYRLEGGLHGAKRYGVFEPSCFLNPLYRAETLKEAKRFVDAYRNGTQWAVSEALNARSAWVG